MAGVHSDKDVLFFKSCSPVFNERERFELVRSLRYVDVVIEGFPYDYHLNDMCKANIQLNVHGDDVCYDKNGIPLYQVPLPSRSRRSKPKMFGIEWKMAQNFEVESTRFELS